MSLLIIAVSLASFAQTSVDDAPAGAKNLHQWGALTLFHGLPSDRVRAIAQGVDGIMWLGTDRGLARYDGRRIQALTSEEIPGGRVLALEVDSEGVLWVGTETGATRLVNGEFRSIREATGQSITAIVTPERGRAVLASEQGVVFDCRKMPDGALAARMILDQSPSRADASTRESPQINGLALSGETVYIGTRSRGLLALEGNTVKEVQSRPHPLSINAMGVDAQGHLWMSARTKGEASVLYEASDLTRPKRVDAGLGKVTALGADGRGGFWVTTDGRGVFRYRDSQKHDHFTFEGTAGGLRSNNIYTVFVDREDVVWFGTDRGVCRYDPQSPRNEDVSTDRQSNFVRALFQTKDGRLLCGTNRGLFLRDDAAAVWRPVEEFDGLTIYAITEDRAGRLLVGSSSGLYIDVNLERKTANDQQLTDADPTADSNTGESPESPAETSASPSPDAAVSQPKPVEQKPIESVRAICTFRDKTYIAIYGRGIERLDGERRTLIWPTGQSDPRLREVTSLHPDGSDGLWIGTARAGVFVFNGQQVTQDHASEKLAGSAVWAIDGTRKGGLWLATARGLYGYRAGEWMEVVAGADVRGVAASGEDDTATGVWCATAGGGLLRVSLDQQLGTLVSRLDVEQGLSSPNAFAILRVRSSSGEESLLIGTTRGIVRYSPGKTLPVLTATRILSRRLHQPEELRAGISLDYPQNSLALDVAALSSRTFPEQFQYAFLLRDGQGSLIKGKLSHDSQFLMDNLQPGLYRVEARAFTKDLVASEPLAFEFSVAKAPFPWITVALSVLLALALLALLWAIIEHRRIARTSAALAKANSELAGARLELANEAERERRRIARDLHDQTLADLRHLMMLTDQLPASGTGNGRGRSDLDATAFRTEIESVSNEIRRICEDLSPSVLENVGLAAALEWALANAVAHAPPQNKFEYEFVSEEGIEERLNLAPSVQMQVYRIAQEAINNVCRHSGATRVRLTITTSSDASFVMTLEDDGRHFDPQNKKETKGRGLANIRARASLIEAEVSWTKSHSGGTLFTFRKTDAVKDTALT
ncbi:MAG TPA: two-component regulator propeller domain-containing protein [Pyrinomonadaceae bacterium]|nr:two-component regulator propeller domain-containing protein [Pyrinomonadaceae bacterium]